MNRRDFFKAALGTVVGVSVLSVARNIMSSSEQVPDVGYFVLDSPEHVKDNIFHIGSKILLVGKQSQITRVRATFLPRSDQWSWIPGPVHWHLVPVPHDKNIDWTSENISQILLNDNLYVMAEKLPRTPDEVAFGLGNIWLAPIGFADDMLSGGQYQYLEIPGTREPRRFRYPMTG